MQEVVNMNNMIQTAGPSISQKEVDYTLDAVKNGWYENWSGYITRFEEEFAKYIGTKYAISTSSCTGALHLILASLRLKKGDEIIVPNTTWVATANVVKYVNAEPIFADVDKETYTLSPESLERSITEKTRAIIPVHLYGHPADMDPILEIADEHGLYIIEDAAPSIGSEYKGKKVGNLGDAAGFSFQGAKLMVTGEGGMLVTDNDEIYETASLIANQGRDPHIDFWIKEVGLKYKMSNIQAALGLAQLERIEELISKKKAIYNWYKNKLSGLEGIQLSTEKEWARSIHWMTSLVLDDTIPLEREELRNKLLSKNIDTRPLFPPINKFSMFKGCSCPNSEFLYKRGINLPSALNLTKDDVNFVSDTLVELLELASKVLTR